jgi:transcription antitermination factor NusG
MPSTEQFERVSSGAVERGPWCALYTRHQHEATVARILGNKGVAVFLPTYRTVHRWKDRNKQLVLPLFPGYVFCTYESERRIQILSTPGVHTIVTNGANSPAEIPMDEIQAIRRAVESPFRMEPHPYLKGGDVVRIKSGPLEGLEGIVSRSKDAFRVVLSVEMLGKSAAVDIDAASVERVRSSSGAGISAVRPS